jgi:indolepyruvate ferredoxin oxidoreductase
MAYKDEYEVARLHADQAFAREIAEAFEGDYRLSYHLAPPILSRSDSSTGRPRKLEFGSWMGKALAGLAKLKFLRGSPFDPFGYSEHRKRERRVVWDYQTEILARCETLDEEELPDVTRLATLPQSVRGFGLVKDKNMDALYSEWGWSRRMPPLYANRK